jgi:hypothetical protein
MSGSGNEQMAGAAEHLTPLVEAADDSHSTRMAYEPTSRTPWYVVSAWVVFAIAYVAYQLIYLLPDLRLWFAAGG